MKRFRVEIIVGIIAIIMFALIAIFTFVIGPANMDTVVYEFIASWRNNFTISFFKIFTHIAGKIVTIALVIMLAFVLINRKKSTYKTYVKHEKWNNFLNLIMPWLIFALSILLVTILFFILKAVFARVRPVDWFLIYESGYSFPSGHTSTAVAMYGALALIINNSINKKWLKILVWIIFISITILVGISRIFLGVHYFTDILGGLFLGILVITISSIFIKVTNTKINLRNDK